jgi:alpha-galactosidase
MHPDIIDAYNIPLDEYPRGCEEQIAPLERQRGEVTGNERLSHERTHEYGSYIMESVVKGSPTSIHGNLLNRGLIPNLPGDAAVEVPCLVDRNGVHGTYFGELPVQCAALNRTNSNVQLRTIEAALQESRELVYQAAALDPHRAAELPLDRIRSMCDELLDAHAQYLATGLVE